MVNNEAGGFLKLKAMMLEIFFKVEAWMIGMCTMIVAAVIVIGGLLYVIKNYHNNGDDNN